MSTLQEELSSLISFVDNAIKEIGFLDERNVYSYDKNSFSCVGVEPFWGIKTQIEIEKTLDNDSCNSLVNDFISSHLPNFPDMLLTPFGTMKAPSGFNFILSMYRKILEDYGEFSEDACIDFVEKFSKFINSDSFELHCFIPLLNFNSNFELGELILNENIFIVKMKKKKIDELLFELMEGNHNIFMRNLSDYCLIIKRKIMKSPVSGGDLSEERNEFMNYCRILFNNFITCMNLFYDGYPYYFFKEVRFDYYPFFYGAGKEADIYPKGGNVIATLMDKDIIKFIKNFNLIINNKNDGVKLSLDRLSRAIYRRDSVDSLIDAMIGIEALLANTENGELTHRMSLNYAFIGFKDQRMERYKEIRSVFTDRGKVVHGKSPNISKIKKSSEKSINILREIIFFFLEREGVVWSNTIENDFWLEYIFSL